MPFEHTPPQKIITSTIMWILLTATIVFITILLTTAAQIGPAASGAVHGPLNMFSITKTLRTDGVTEVSMAFLPGIINYFILVGVAVIATILARLRLSRVTQA